MYIWYADPDSSQWVAAAPMPDMSSFIQLVTQDTAPALPTSNIPIFWWKSSNGQLFISYNDGTSTQWVAVTPAPIAAIQYDVNQNLTVTQQQQAQANLGLVAVQMRSYLAGLGMTWVSVTSFSVAPGTAADSTNVVMIALNAAMTKTTAAWAAGMGVGGLDTGTIAAAAWYHVHVIRNPSTLAVDVLYSLSATAPTLPSGYTQFRRIGSVVTTGSQFTNFHQNGDEFLFDAPVLMVNGTAVSTTATLFSVGVPTQVQCWAILNVYFTGSAGIYGLITSPDQSSQVQNVPSGNLNLGLISASGGSGYWYTIRTTNGQVRVVASASVNLYINSHGWIDRRGRDN
jgi:hypothetical protein